VSTLASLSSRLVPLLVLLLCCSSPPRSPVQKGAGVFQRSCAGCHGLDAHGGNLRLGFNPPPRNLTDPEFQRQVTDDDLRRTIRIGKGMMPAFGGMLPEEDVAFLIEFIRSLDSSRK
jgi:mono/diheme cytochrome c family protein